MTDELTQEMLKQEVEYRDGHLFRIRSQRSSCAGDKCGSKVPGGYLRAMIRGKKYQVHHLVWLYFTGRFPKDQIDHINGIRSDNRIENLRECSCSENHQNRVSKAGSKSQYLGVSWVNARNKWVANIKVGRFKKQIGYFDCEEAAYRAYLQEKSKFHSFNPIVRQ